MQGETARARRWIWAALAASLLAASPPPWSLSLEERRALEGVRADSLRGHLSFLASDALGGRVTPSPGLDIAAEYVAAQYRRAGLEPLGDDGYFQAAPALVAHPIAEGFRFSLATPAGEVDVPPETFQMPAPEALDLDVAVVKLPPWAEVPAGLAGRAVLTELPEIPPGTGRREGGRRRRQWLAAVAAANPAVVVAIDRRQAVPTAYFDTAVLVEPPSPSPPPSRVVTTSAPPLAQAYDALPPGPAGRLTLHLAEPRRERAVLRNVAGLLRGSDPTLSGTYVLVSAHYDGTGPRPGATGPDRIWNAANDDGSGAVTLLELSSVFSGLAPRPRRSIVFIAFFGEEEGLLGSSYYAAHPLVPLARTVADVNIEHVGRTDSTERNKAGTASLTGYDYSDLPAAFEAAGRLTGIDVYKDAQRSDPFFLGSDNYSLARAGVVAHTVCVLFEDFADYHGPGDEWPKIDFPNMERTVRLIGAAVLMMAEATEEPRWRAEVPPAAPYLAAWQRSHGG